MVCTSLGSLLRPLFYFLFYIHFSLSVYEDPDPLIPEDPNFFLIPDPAPKVAPYSASGKP